MFNNLINGAEDLMSSASSFISGFIEEQTMSKYRKLELSLPNGKVYDLNIPKDFNSSETLTVPVILFKRTVGNKDVYFIMEINVNQVAGSDVIRNPIGISLRFGSVEAEHMSNVVLSGTEWVQDATELQLGNYSGVFILYDRYEYGTSVGERIYMPVEQLSYTKDTGMKHAINAVNKCVNECVEKFKEKYPK